MPGKKLPQSPLPPRSPNYANARGNAAEQDNQDIHEEANPGISPASVPELHQEERLQNNIDGGELKDKNYAQYMNRGDGRYLERNQDSGDGSFGPDDDHAGRTKKIHRFKSE
jgi:hypothetical protein